MYFKNQLKLIEHEYNSKSINSLNSIKFIKSYATESFEAERVYKILENHRVTIIYFEVDVSQFWLAFLKYIWNIGIWK